MNPIEPNIPQSSPAPPQPTPSPTPAQPAGDLPVFRNPLAQGYESGTSQLPPLPPSPPSDESSHLSDHSPDFPAQSTSPPSPPPQPPPSSPSSSPSPSQPTVSELTQSPIKPAPVRLAPVPRSDDLHGEGLQANSQVAPFGAPPISTGGVVSSAPVPSSGVPAQSTVKRKPIGLIIGLAVGLVILSIAGIGGYVYFSKKNSTPVESSPAVAGSIRDTKEKPTQPFSEKISTDCYVAQALTPVETQQNKNCALSITYGEQKVSSIFVSALSQFDIATGEEGDGTGQNTVPEVDTKKYLEALISDIIPKDLVTTRENIKVGNLDAVKVVGKKDQASGVEVAYVFIILPEGDRVFGEKTLVAFIVTGAYSDEYSRKGFDQFLSTWSWK